MQQVCIVGSWYSLLIFAHTQTHIANFPHVFVCLFRLWKIIKNLKYNRTIATIAMALNLV